MTIAWVSVLILLTFTSPSRAGLADLKFSQWQVADSQWNTSSCYYNPDAYNGCQIYSKNPGTMYKIPWYNGQWQWQAGQYVAFVPSGNSSYPWKAVVYNSNGTAAGELGTGKVIYAGIDENGKAYMFFMGNDNNTGQVFSMTEGMANTSGFTFTGDKNPDEATIDNYADNYGSTEPLAEGETAQTSAPPPAPTCGGSSDTSVTCDQASRSDLQYYDNHVSRKSDWEDIDTGHNNIVRIEQIGDNNKIEIDQHLGWKTGGNLVMGRTLADDTATVIGDDNEIDLYQSGNDNVIGLDITGDGNKASTVQSGNGMRNRIIMEGDDNYAFVFQIGNVYGDEGKGHFADIKQTGKDNFASLYQWDENQLVVVDVEADNTMIQTDQRDGENYASIVVKNEFSSVGLNQKGGGDHGANAFLTGTSPTSLEITQDSSTAQIIDVTNSCVSSNGCAITINQQ